MLSNFIPINDNFQKTFLNDSVSNSDSNINQYYFVDKNAKGIILLFTVFFPQENAFVNINIVNIKLISEF